MDGNFLWTRKTPEALGRLEDCTACRFPMGGSASACRLRHASQLRHVVAHRGNALNGLLIVGI